ncbi:MAG: tripartite tricarboxylate transporter substrate binding protein [Ottowia sp.]|uniref:Bug family tripartite tricarboxylate transporter substrate binding protein n=1 Tax=unclassified Ottowia TaxID=2645081 RepID=UPI003C2D0780
MQRRTFLTTASALALPTAWNLAHAADNYPSRPIQVIVPYAAGGADSYVRPLQPALEKNHQVRLVIESLVGAGGTIGAMKVKRSAPDGLTLLFCGSGALTIAPSLQNNGAPRPSDLTPILNLTNIPYVIAVRKDMPVRNAAEFISFIKQNPGKLNYGTPGTGSAPHLGMEGLAQKLGTSVTHVPFAGVTAAVQSLLGGHIDAVIGAPSNVMPQISSNAVRGIAVTSKKRFPFAKDLPTLAEAGADMEVTTHFGFFGPKGMPAAYVQKLATVIREAAEDPAYAKVMEGMQTPVDLLTADVLAQELAAEQARFEPLLAGMRQK